MEDCRSWQGNVRSRSRSHLLPAETYSRKVRTTKWPGPTRWPSGRAPRQCCAAACAPGRAHELCRSAGPHCRGALPGSRQHCRSAVQQCLSANRQCPPADQHCPPQDRALPSPQTSSALSRAALLSPGDSSALSAEQLCLSASQHCLHAISSAEARARLCSPSAPSQPARASNPGLPVPY